MFRKAQLLRQAYVGLREARAMELALTGVIVIPAGDGSEQIDFIR